MHGGEFNEFYANSSNKKDIINTINECDKFIVLSERWKKYFESKGVNREKILILNNCIPSPKHFSKSFNINTRPLRILYLGTLVKEKGIFDLLDVITSNMPLLKNNIELTIGGNRNETVISELIKQNHLEDFVFFKGWISGEDKIEEYIKADILVLPSYFEALPMVILEAISYKCAILATNVGGIPDIITSHKNGLLFTPGDKNELKNNIFLFIKNRHLIYEYTNEGSKIITNFYPKSVFHDLKKIYEDILINQ